MRFKATKAMQTLLPVKVNIIMTAYQEKWIEMFKAAHIPEWRVQARQNDVEIFVPADTDLKVLRDNFPETVAAMALDITLPKERVKFIIHNGKEETDYILNPDERDLTKP